MQRSKIEGMKRREPITEIKTIKDHVSKRSQGSNSSIITTKEQIPQCRGELDCCRLTWNSQIRVLRGTTHTEQDFFTLFLALGHFGRKSVPDTVDQSQSVRGHLCRRRRPAV